MAIIREAIVAFVIISTIAATVAGFNENGLPRPANVPDAPTTTFGKDPEVKNPDGSTADCTWYGFANEKYNASVGEVCLEDLRVVLMNVSSELVTLEPYVYYYSFGLTGSDPVTHDPYCFEGCFNLKGGALPPNYFAGYSPPAPAPVPDCYIRGPALAPFYWPGTPPIAGSNIAPSPQSGA